jgi:hypothetical protein
MKSMINLKKHFMIAVIILIATNLKAQSTRYYVNKSVSVPSPDGLSWSTAFADIQDAIDAGANDTLSSEIEIWITGGGHVYTPTDSAGITPINPRDASYIIPTVSKRYLIYGGFNGTEANLSERTRDLLNNHTIISGEIGNPQSTNDNLENLLIIRNGNFSNYTVTLDGIGFYNAYTSNGLSGAVNNQRYMTRFQNCFFKNNISYGDGAAIHSTGYKPIINKCQFYDNEAMQGGALYIGSGGLQANYPEIYSSRFVRNKALLGGAIKIDNMLILIVNCEFIDNTSLFNGHGSALSEVNGGTYSVVNSNFIHNNGNTLFHVGSVNINNYFVNCIFFKNSKIRNSNNNNVRISFSLSEESLTFYTNAGNNLVGDPKFKYYNPLDSQSYGNFALKNCSPAINAGNNGNITPSINAGYIDGDISGNPRMRDGIVDIGAYEYNKDSLVYENGVLLCPLALDSNSVVSILNCTSGEVISSSPATTIPQSYIPRMNASYAMIFRYPDGCIDTTKCLSVVVVVPNAPSNLQATPNINPISVKLTWTDNSLNEDGFVIERSSDSLNFTVIDSVGQNVTTYTDTVSSATTYYYKVKAYNTAGNSGYSNIAQVTTSTVGIRDISKQLIYIYPNPAKSAFTIQGVKERCVYSLSNLSGRILVSGITSQVTTVDVQHLESGIYFLQLGNHGTFKILINH